MTSHSVIGNGAFGAVIDNRARIVWCSPEGFGGDPILNSLLNNDSDEGGFFDITISNLAKSEQKYIPSTAVLVTTLVSATGDVLQIKDFAPRFCTSTDTVGRPCQIFRIVSRIRGDPIATARVRPSFDYNSSEGYVTRGSHHIRYCGTNGTWRLTTNAPIQLIMDEAPFLVHETIYLVFGQDETVSSDLAQLCKDYEDRTIRHWKNWSANLALPVDYQEILLRSAITIQLLQSDEIGGIVNSFTLGIPLGGDLGPTRDERAIQLTDICLSLPVLRELGLHGTIKKFTVFLKSLLLRDEPLQTVYGYRGQAAVPAIELSSMAGYLGVGPAVAGGITTPLVRDTGIYGLTITALSGAFFDVRMKDVCSPKLLQQMEQLGLLAVKAFADMIDNRPSVFTRMQAPGLCSGDSMDFFEDDVRFLSLPDRDRARLGGHTLTAVLCWAAVDRLARIAEHNHWIEKSKSWFAHAQFMREKILTLATCSSRGVINSFWGHDRVGPGILRLAELGFLDPHDPLFVKSVEAFETDSLRILPFSRTGEWSHLAPCAPVLVSTLCWYAEALRAIGKVSEARGLFHALCASSNECGLLSQSIDLKDGRHWGNLAYLPTLLGLLRLGTRLSRSWRGV